MHAFVIGFLLVALIQVSCDGAPQGLTPMPTPHTDVSEEKPADVSQEKPPDDLEERSGKFSHADVSEEKPADLSQEKPPDVSQEKHLEERAGCRADKQDRGNCLYWKNSNYCHRGSRYYAYMQDHCYATCTNCNSQSTSANQACRADKQDRGNCLYWKNSNYCHRGSRYYAYMQDHCYATCTNCNSQSTSANQGCRADKQDRGNCLYWKNSNYCQRSSRYYAYMQDHCYATCTNCNSAQGSTGSQQEQVKNACLEAHNYRRAQHGAPALEWDATLAQHAQAWADHLAGTNTFEHATNTGEGENLFKSGGDATYKEAVEAWYSEEKLYNYNHPGFSMATGHFTQVVWKSTTKLGCAIQKRERETFVVARYSPPGNVMGAFAENVGRKNSG